MRIIRFNDLTETPWKNGGGITREIGEARQDGSLIWRLSMADVAGDGTVFELRRAGADFDGD